MLEFIYFTRKDSTYLMSDISTFCERVIENLEKVIVGKRQSVELIVIGLLCQGHVLIEDVPGVGKTMLARSLARSLDCTFNQRLRRLYLKLWKNGR